MSSTGQNCGMMKRITIALTVGAVLAAVALWLAAGLEFEFPFWPTLWLASHSRAVTGKSVTELVRIRSGRSYVAQHWHHCTWCDVVYPHAPHSAVKVTINRASLRTFRSPKSKDI